MRFSWRWGLRVVLVVVAGVILWVRLVPHGRVRVEKTPAVTDLSQTSPLNQPGGGPAPADAYAVYSSLYAAPMEEPLVFAEASGTDIPQVGGSCLKPSMADEKALTQAFEAANAQSHTWEPKFSIPQGYRLVSREEAGRVLACLATDGHDAAACSAYKGIKHVRTLGVPGFDATHTHALVSVIKRCGGECGSGGVFAVEKTGDTWKRAATTDFTRDCSWMY